MRFRREEIIICAFTLTIFLNAFLLFLIQPMFARMILPRLGGSSAVWNTAMVFYQAALLGGYAYAHVSTTRLGLRGQTLLHLGLLLVAALALPIRIPAGWNPPVASSPIPWLLALMAVGIGMPFFVASAGSPLLQRWFAATGHQQSADPYFLYAASNLGSMLALIFYPAFMEPKFQLRQQTWWWSIGYGALFLLMGFCILLVRRSQLHGTNDSASGMLKVNPTTTNTSESRNPCLGESVQIPSQSAVAEFGATWSKVCRRLQWVILAAVPSSLMLSVTTYLTTDMASVPLFWIIPLAIYLLTFIMVFSRRSPLPHQLMVKAFPIVLLPLVITMAGQSNGPITLLIPLHLTAFYIIAMVCHGELAHDRPAAVNLTEFYMLMSIGGVLGGIFSAILAPAIFSSVVEYPLVLTIACLLLPWKATEPWYSRARILDIALPLAVGLLSIVLIRVLGSLQPSSTLAAAAAVFGLPVFLSFSFSRRPLRFALAVGAIFLAGTHFAGSESYFGRGTHLVHAERSFFGVIKIIDEDSGRYRLMVHGSTLHGGQSLEPTGRREPLFYYHRLGPLGQFFQAFIDPVALKNVAVMGLGTGAISSYARSGQIWTYYEIDSHIESIAKDPRYFTYLHDCPIEPRVVPGDGRLSLSEASDAAYDLLILDAYSSDSIPIHLLTREALQLYLKKLTSCGILIFHISNSYLDLEPVLGNLAQQVGLCSITQRDIGKTGIDPSTGKASSIYVLMSRAKSNLGPFYFDNRWTETRTRPDLGIWTDDYSSILSIIKWPTPF